MDQTRPPSDAALSDAALSELADRLARADYSVDAVADRLGPDGQAGLGRNTTVAVRDALGADCDAQASLVRLWLLHDEVDAADAERALGPLGDHIAAGLLERDGDVVRAGVEIRPYATDDGLAGWICHDLNPGLDGRVAPVRPDFVLGASPASTTLAQISVRTPVAAALDLGTGCGVQSLHLARHAGRVVATDLNPRALDLARITARLSSIDVDLRIGDLYEPIDGERFDLIVSNPPYVMSPPHGERLTYREGRLQGDELVRRVVAEGPRHLAPGGTMQLVANWAIVRGEPWQERLASWLRPTGCDALVLERERLSVYEYVEMWLADAGLSGSAGHAERYREWLDYFEALGIEEVGMGWLSVAALGHDDPTLRFEEWPHAVHQPVGAALAAWNASVGLLAEPDEVMLATRWTVDPRVVQETMGRPGAEDPEHIVLRQSFGLGRATAVDTMTAAVVGACDGDLPLGLIVDAVASLTGQEASGLHEAVAAKVRELAVDGYLLPG